MLPSAGSGTIVPDPASTLAFQSEVTFDLTGSNSLKNPRVWVVAYQNGVLVYGEGGGPGSGSTITFKLGGDSSQWVFNGGGPANCTAELYYILNAHGTGEWNGKGAQGGTVVLGTCSFDATG